uniref:Uncharacterized protein n=1 Tax=Neobodo designis TaxID=312471 RepID=A0A7S1KZF6_NEODS|mmetsp:Transcript_11739/g.36456  ORF Transcript_11739/g.36456 Transcript_11739/m.36456 type:complete len:294 (+) Transcript_11739:328-1209(+)
MPFTAPMTPATLPSPATLQAALAAIEEAVMPSVDAELAAVAAQQATGHLHGGCITPFHSCAVPGVTLPQYAVHVAKTTGYTSHGLAHAIAMMGRFAVATRRGITPLAMHRLSTVAMQVGMKCSNDAFVKNVYVAKLAGMTLPELNHLEEFFVNAINFDCMPSDAELCDLPRALAALYRNGAATHANVHAQIQRFAFTSPLPVAPAKPLATEMIAEDESAPLAMPVLFAGVHTCGVDPGDANAASISTAAYIHPNQQSFSTASPRLARHGSATSDDSVCDTSVALEGESFAAVA